MLFKTLINNLTSTLGYVEGVTVRGAPYDFRWWGDACYTKTYFEQLRALVEDTYTKNNNSRVVSFQSRARAMRPSGQPSPS